MTAAQSHRGPDDEGLLKKQDLVLGHRRLSIVDLSSAGRQPMSNEDSTIWVALVGEIYNHRELRAELHDLGHRFASVSDTEVLLHGYEAWGIELLLKRLRGMFSFVIFDVRDSVNGSKLILARDRFGIKPLYYALLPNDRLVFASEVRALLQSGLVSDEEDPRSWLAFLLFGAVPVPWTTVKSVRVLEPGHYLVADRSGMKLTRYYSIDELFIRSESLDAMQSNGRRLLPGLGSEIRVMLEETVSLHLMSDAPLGVFLSGGIDSSALVALAARRQKQLVTLGVMFAENTFSEEAFQKTIAERFNTLHHSVTVRFEDFRTEMEHFLRAMDEPTIDGLNTYFVAQAARQVGLKTVLSGIGGDEIFCGYPTLRRAPMFSRLASLPMPLLTAVVAAGRFRPSLRKLEFLKRSGSLSFYLAQRGLFAPEEAARLLETSEREAWEIIQALEPSEASKNPVLLQQFLESRYYLRDQLLKDADVFGMAHSVEIRVPFLDHVLVELALKFPLMLRLDRRWPKPLLTRSLLDLLPKGIIFRPKQGFVFPMEIWLRASPDLLRNQSSGLNRDACRAVWGAFLAGRVHWSRPWALAVLAHARS